MSQSTGEAGTYDEIQFTYDWYRRFLGHLDDEYTFCRYEDDIEPGTAILRHDVDLSPGRALTTARMEAERDISATYFFLVSSPLYNPIYDRTRTVIEEIIDLGHDVGLHFSTHQYWGVDEDPADEVVADKVDKERTALATAGLTTDVVSFHVPPDWALRRRFNGFTSTYEPRFFDEIDYASDSDQKWRDQPPRLGRFGEKLQVLIHPGLWGESDESFEQRVYRAVTGSETRADTYAQSRYIEQIYG